MSDSESDTSNGSSGSYRSDESDRADESDRSDETDGSDEGRNYEPDYGGEAHGMDDDRSGEGDFWRSRRFEGREMYEGKNVPYNTAGCQVDSVQYGHYDDGEFCNGGVG